jgi:TetR/AcrR family transcriptional repressor of mexJK operon
MDTQTSSAEQLLSGRPNGKRGAIVSAACSVFLSQGFGAASMDAVAAAAGVSKMTVYRYFRSKEELFAGVVAEMCDRIMDADVAARMADLPPREALRLFGTRMLETVFAPQTIGLHRLVIAESGRFPELGRLFYESGPGANIKMLTEYLRQHAKDPALDFADPAQAAEEFMALLRGYEHMRALLGVSAGPSRRKIAIRVERAMRQLLI